MDVDLDDFDEVAAYNERRREEETRRAFDQTRGCEESEEVIATARVDVSSHVCACVCVCVCASSLYKMDQLLF